MLPVSQTKAQKWRVSFEKKAAKGFTLWDLFTACVKDFGTPPSLVCGDDVCPAVHWIIQ